MNYRHAFHAGNFADVVKHLILVRIIAYLRQKPTPFRVIDTHAGRGRYDLTGPEAQQSPEWLDGIARLAVQRLPDEAADLEEPYFTAIAAENPDGELKVYPGSPVLVRYLLRAQDRLSAIELHPEDAAELARQFEGDHRTRVTHLDGWLALRGHVPPKEARGVVLVDPPYEQEGELQRLVDSLQIAHRKWATGIYALWYPIKDPRDLSEFYAELRASNIAKMMRIEVTVRPPSSPPRLHGTGMIVVNPPHVLEEELKVLLPPLTEILGENGQGQWKIDWIKGE